MDAHAAAEVEEWEPVSFSGGYEGLHELADSEFSGAVESGGATLYMVNGRAVAIDGGTIEEFETGGTARGAPHHSLPLLYAMQTRDGRTRASYYTEDTPIPDVDQTLTEGEFTGYVELAENVLSGDYYVIYHGGRSTGVAFIGQSRRVVTGQEAYDRACDEVGIYEVVSVDLDVIEIPGEPPGESDESDATAGAAAGAAAVDEAAGEDASEDGKPEPAAEEAPGDATAAADDGAVDTSQEGDAAGAAGAGAPGEQADEAVDGDSESTGAGETPDSDAGDDTAGVAGAAAGLEESDVRPVPSVDPDRSARAETPVGAGTADEATTDDGSAAGPAAGEATAETATGGTGPAAGEVELPELRRELAATREERDELLARVERLETRIEELGGDAATATGDGTPAGPELSTAEALPATNLFVRYHSKARPTLEDSHAGEAAPADVRENLRIEHHTQFESEGATVDGRPFEAWLADRPEWAFLEWLVEEVLFEIRATGSVEAMRKLYGAIPDIDRVELDVTINVEDVVGDGSRDVEFDLVARGPRGDPLVVADIESSREPTTGDALASLVTDATDLVAVDDALAGAFFVTASYFEPDALATAEDATGGSLLSRDRRASFVKHSRKRGYHLCLVERREETFHLKQPDL